MTKNPKIHLEKVTEDNVEDVVALRVTKEQREFECSERIVD